MTGVIAAIYKNIYLRTALLNRRNEIKAKEYAKDVLVNHQELTSAEGREIVKVAAKLLDDDLFKVANKSDELKDGKGID